MTWDFDQRIDRRHSDSVKWQKYGDRDILPMWIADTDFRSADCITDALQQRVAHGVFGYGSQPQELGELFIERMQRQYSWRVEPQWLVFLPGVVCGLHLSVRALTTSRERSIAPAPVYPRFRQAAVQADREQIDLPLRLNEQRWVLSLDGQDDKLNGTEKLLMLCNPHNPGGTVYTREELEAQLRFAQRHDLWVCSDEIHCDLLLDKDSRHIPFASLSEDAAQRSITLMSPSKTFNIAGLGASIAVIPNEQLRRKFNHARLGIVPDPNVLSLVAAAAAWRDGQPWLDAQLAYLRRNRQTLVDFISTQPLLRMASPQASYLGWIDASQLGVTNPAEFFEQHGLGFTSGQDFGDNRFVRFNFGCRHALLEEALRRMAKATAARG